ncbi:hypothetical protein PQX77_012279 [Marasmius sp. AFHP31]|nr:hypothetical protein PQX77_012279 [Marasmius sp. AFHP31]
MAFKRLTAFFLCASALLGASAANSYSVAWDAPELTTVTGFFTLPNLPKIEDGSLVGPGLHNSDGVLQVVYDARWSNLWIGPEFRGTPAVPWGPGFEVDQGEEMKFLFNHTDDGYWVVEVGWATGGGAHGGFGLEDNVLNSAVFTADLNEIPFDFGPINYRNVSLTATTPASEWCDKFRQVGDYPLTVTGTEASGNTCTVASITQDSPQ